MYPRTNMFICAAALVLLTACDDPPKADDSNFEKTLQGYYDSHPVCAAIPLTFPVDLLSDGDAARKRQLEPLVAAGLIAVTTIQKIPPAAPRQGKATDSLRHAPTTAGQPAVRPGAAGFLGGTVICFTTRKVVRLTSP